MPLRESDWGVHEDARRQLASLGAVGSWKLQVDPGSLDVVERRVKDAGPRLDRSMIRGVHFLEVQYGLSFKALHSSSPQVVFPLTLRFFSRQDQDHARLEIVVPGGLSGDDRQRIANYILSVFDLRVQDTLHPHRMFYYAKRTDGTSQCLHTVPLPGICTCPAVPGGYLPTGR
jgi:hypothetical protein